MERPAPSLKARALRLLATREHSRLELQQKLAPHAESAQALAQLLDDLHAKGLINEQRVLESVLYRRAAKLGTARIRQELQAKGLPEAAVQAATEQLRSTELNRARAVWSKKFGAPAQTPQERAQQLRFLSSRGFSADVLRRVVSGADDLD